MHDNEKCNRKNNYIATYMQVGKWRDHAEGIMAREVLLIQLRKLGRKFSLTDNP
ncbi:MAG: hypothetical protein OXC82_01190 [Rhodobacteraceae bacterium]|nr:hypothetical protein [Paracoccaceae bacterium]MCY4249042.1 hypothetical protein [Paracoccaceae bacterium]